MLVIYTHLAHAWVGAPEQSLEVATRCATWGCTELFCAEPFYISFLGKKMGPLFG